jgi:hypothetical protein
MLQRAATRSCSGPGVRLQFGPRDLLAGEGDEGQQWRTADERDGSRQLEILEGQRSSDEMMLTATGGERAARRLVVDSACSERGWRCKPASPRRSTSGVAHRFWSRQVFTVGTEVQPDIVELLEAAASPCGSLVWGKRWASSGDSTRLRRARMGARQGRRA